MFHYPKTYMVLGAFILAFMIWAGVSKIPNEHVNHGNISKDVRKCIERGFDYSSCKKDPSQKQ